MKNNLTKMSLGVLILCFMISCDSIREPRAFREKPFDSNLWREGDAQTRGEMSKDLRWKKSESGNYVLYAKTRREVLAILGEPDRKTRGKCCGAGGTSDEEVWLYKLEVADEKNKLTNEHFQIYFTESGKTDEWRIALWDDKNPDYFPRVG
jgi:hypothetical protein